MNRRTTTRAEILQQLQSSDSAAMSLASGITNEQANWRPNAASWSIWQCLDHLGRINHVYCAAMRDAIEQAQKPGPGTSTIDPGWLSRKFIAQMEPPARMRSKAPAKAIPGPGGDIQLALRAFLDSHQLVRDIVASWETVNLNRVRFRNPFVPVLRFTIGTGLLVVNAHDRRHLWQAQLLKAAELFPSG